MTRQEIEFQKRIQATFRIEAEEHINALSANLAELETMPSMDKSAPIIEVIFREVHSLKGAARSINETDIEEVCRPMESIFSVMKQREMSQSPQLFDVLYKTVKWLSKRVFTTGEEQSAAMKHEQQKLVLLLKETASGRSSSGSAADAFKETVVQESAILQKVGTVRIPVSKLDALLLQAEEMVQSKITLDHRIQELKLLYSDIKEWKTDGMHLSDAERQLSNITKSMVHDQYLLDRLVNHHLEAVKQVLMLPVSIMVETLPGMVREISREQNKEIDFKIEGAELEIDKRILEELKDPLVHLIRNSISHGIGTPHERLQQFKPVRGNITLSFAAKESRYFEVTLSDDGNGIDTEQLLKTAINSRIISEEAAGKLQPEEVLNLIFKSGVSTSPVITDLSGHGLGLSIVHEKVMNLNGKISVETEKEKGTTFRITLPMALSTFRGILLDTNGFMFIIPSLNVRKVLRAEEEEIKTVENFETIRIDGKIVPVADLGEILGLSSDCRKSVENMNPSSAKTDSLLLVVLTSGETCAAFKVDNIDGEQQVILKGLGKLLHRVRNLSGVTILGSGKVVPVINVSDLIKSASGMKLNTKIETIEEPLVTKDARILVAEDSITSRILIKNILETAGYKVITSINGADAYTKVRSEAFDLVVSDVDMPEMNGFELTMKMKSDKNLKEIPVILLTALESHGDRERGIDAGADAYIVKSSFDQDNLLEVIKKLI